MVLSIKGTSRLRIAAFSRSLFSTIAVQHQPLDMSSGYLVFYCNIFYNVIFICILFRIIACCIGLSIENCPDIQRYIINRLPQYFRKKKKYSFQRRLSVWPDFMLYQVSDDEKASGQIGAEEFPQGISRQAAAEQSGMIFLSLTQYRHKISSGNSHGYHTGIAYYIPLAP